MNKVQAGEIFNLRAIQRDYIGKLLSEQPGHKYLVLDAYTMDCVSVAFFRSELFDYKVFDSVSITSIETLTTQGSVAGVFLVRPLDENVALITQLLHSPPFDKVYICTLG
jgi:hypothetical protein